MPVLSTSHSGPSHQIESLEREHRALKEQVREMASRPYLTSEQQIELVQLKKMKLQKKDLIAELRRQV